MLGAVVLKEAASIYRSNPLEWVTADPLFLRSHVNQRLNFFLCKLMLLVLLLVLPLRRFSSSPPRSQSTVKGITPDDSPGQQNTPVNCRGCTPRRPSQQKHVSEQVLLTGGFPMYTYTDYTRDRVWVLIVFH